MIRLGVFFVGMILIIAATCERPLDIKLEEPEARLVVISNFTNNQAIQVQVSKSRSVLNTGDIAYINDAVVEIFDEDLLLETLELVPLIGKTPPFYTTRVLVPEVDVVYTIKVEAPGFDPVMAHSKIPPKIDIHSLEITDLIVREGEMENELIYSYTVSLSFEDPEEQLNYYHLNFYQQIINYINIEGDTTILDTYLQQIDFSPAIDNNSLIAYFEGGVLFEDTPFNGKLIAYTFPLQVRIDEANELIGKMFVELRAVSEEYYQFYNSLSRQQENPGIPFTEPVILFNNIENGQGIFAGYNLSVDSIAVIW